MTGVGPSDRKGVKSVKSDLFVDKARAVSIMVRVTERLPGD